MSDVRVGFVGAGFMAQLAHITCFQQAEGAEVTAIASSRPKLLVQVANRFFIDKRYPSYQEIGQDPDIDLAAVIVPPEINVRICTELLEAGKHVFCEKPVAISAADARRLADAAKAAGRHLLVGFMKRFDAGVQAAKNVVSEWQSSGEAGNLLYARVHSFIGGDWTANIEGLFPVIKTDEPMSTKEHGHFPEWLNAEEARSWSPYYFFNHVHSHDMDLIGFFLGSDFEVTYADWSHEAKFAALDFAGTPATIEVGKCSENHRWDEELAIYFEGGSVHISLPPPMLVNMPAVVKVYYMGDRQEVCDVHARYSWSFLNQAQNAVDVVARKAAPICTSDDGLAQLRMIEAIFKAIQGA